MIINNPKQTENQKVNADDSMPSNSDILMTVIVTVIIASCFIAVGFYFITNPDWINNL